MKGGEGSLIKKCIFQVKYGWIAIKLEPIASFASSHNGVHSQNQIPSWKAYLNKSTNTHNPDGQCKGEDVDPGILLGVVESAVVEDEGDNHESYLNFLTVGEHPHFDILRLIYQIFLIKLNTVDKPPFPSASQPSTQNSRKSTWDQDKG